MRARVLLGLGSALTLGLLLGDFGSLGSLETSPASANIEKPNIVVVIADDQPALDGRLIDYMPTVKSVLKDQGVTFTDFHVETPTCCPGRAGFLSGQHTTNHNVTINWAARFNPSMSLATQLKGAGYHTMLVGKYMNGYGSCTGTNCAPNVPPGWDRWAAFARQAFYNYYLYVDGEATPVFYGSNPDDYSTDLIAERASEMIATAPADEPIFAWIAPASPHSPNTIALRHQRSLDCQVPAWRPPNYKEADVSDKPAWVQAIGVNPRNPNVLPAKCKMLLSVDELVATVRSTLAAQGRLENTLFIYTDDNAMDSGEHRLRDKGSPYQTQVPFLASWPAELGITPRTISERLSNIDLAPTLCEIAGCQMGPYPNGQATPDGLSFAGLLLGTQTTIDRAYVYENMPGGNKPAPPWHSVTSTSHSALASVGCAASVSSGCLWHYIEYPTTGEEELYDMSNGPCWTWSVDQPGDPCELENMASDPAYAGIKAVLQGELARLRVEKGQE